MNLGESDSSNNFSENYEPIEYHSPNNTIRFENVPGIEVNVASTTYDIGCGVSFRVLGDFMTINEVGPIANPSISNELGLSSYNNGNLVFQYLFQAIIIRYHLHLIDIVVMQNLLLLVSKHILLREEKLL